MFSDRLVVTAVKSAAQIERLFRQTARHLRREESRHAEAPARVEQVVRIVQSGAAEQTGNSVGLSRNGRTGGDPYEPVAFIGVEDLRTDLPAERLLEQQIGDTFECRSQRHCPGIHRFGLDIADIGVNG